MTRTHWASMYYRIKDMVSRIASARSGVLSQLRIEDRKLILSVKSKRLTYLTDRRLRCLVECSRRIEQERIPGIFVEAGCALGGSTIILASAKQRERELYVYDVFGMIPAPTSDDPDGVHSRYDEITSGKSRGIGGDTYYGYEADLYRRVQMNLREFGIEPELEHLVLVKGLVQDTMDISQQVALAHIDVDWYEPVKTCLERIVPHLAVGGALVLDDYHDWGGCKKATDEYFHDRLEQFVVDDSSGSRTIVKISPAPADLSPRLA